VKGNRRLAVVGAPADLESTLGAHDVRAGVPKADVILLFTPNRARFDALVPSVLATSSRDAILWVAYPKLTSRLAADLSRDIIHGLAPEYGLDTVSQIAIDNDWSALRLKRMA
ncbi:MAG TPA: hypothetical protein VMB71_03765, partial [Acetobacteraceae bacterium]|nr:hypothetical protein [Acetobacteraceae bacterium]